ncbi:hypothetical protein SAMN05444411_10228 [Lutibacter oricola]|uniref:Peptidylprolyl isomerase n=1 Tax=Lutibacter oricola TaxID=762486 RepID=A0A1H2VSG5_9FLAO|nr:hypothetical protein [Lutibacter oricola]SDW71216.1 hypothetical protein SAMN05444411_10228 [Lutibacter oricola]
MKNIIVYIFVVVLFSSCNYFTLKKEESKIVARVNTAYLYEKDLAKVVTNGVSKQDSTLLVNNYINNWVKQQLLLSKAELNLADKVDKFDDLVKKYKEDLYINSYKEAVVKEYLNTEITDKDIEDFYAKNNENFKLNEELLKLKFVKVANNYADKKELVKLFKSSKKEDLESLKSDKLFLQSYHLNDSIWIKYTDLISKVPVLKILDKKELLKNGKFIQKEDSLSLYLVTIKKVLNRNEIAPKSYITPTVKQLILHQRKLLLLKNIEETLIDDAQKKEQFEIY